jgi:hypothetical protein
MSAAKLWTSDAELPGVAEDGMPGKNGQQKRDAAIGASSFSIV